MILQVAQWGLLLLGCFVFLDAWRSRRLVLFLFLIVDAYLFELILLLSYHAVTYNSSLLSLGGIPWIVIIGWASLLYAHLRFYRSHSLVVRATLIAVSMTFVDLVMDKVMTHVGFWAWNNPSGYFGIPYENFFAWLLYAFLVAFFIGALFDTQGKRVYTMLVRAFVCITALGLAIGVLWNQLSLSGQSTCFWLFFVTSFLYIVWKSHAIICTAKGLYLLCVPLAFFGMSFVLMCVVPGFDATYVALSLAWFLLWLGILAWTLCRFYFSTLNRSTSA